VRIASIGITGMLAKRHLSSLVCRPSFFDVRSSIFGVLRSFDFPLTTIYFSPTSLIQDSSYQSHEVVK
jgi:hypothetical protein